MQRSDPNIVRKMRKFALSHRAITQISEHFLRQIVFKIST